MYRRGSASRVGRAPPPHENSATTLANGRERKRVQVAVCVLLYSSRMAANQVFYSVLEMQEEEDQVHWNECGWLLQLQGPWNSCEPLCGEASELLQTSMSAHGTKWKPGRSYDAARVEAGGSPPSNPQHGLPTPAAHQWLRWWSRFVTAVMAVQLATADQWSACGHEGPSGVRLRGDASRTWHLLVRRNTARSELSL